MKRILALILILALALSLAACKSETEEIGAAASSEETAGRPLESEISNEISDMTEDIPTPGDEPADAPADKNTVVTEAQVPELSNDDVIDAYKACVEFRDYWYRGGNLDAMTEDSAEYEGVPYCAYVAGDIDTFAELEAEALTHVSPEIFSAWQENYKYTDIDGKLYGPVNYGSGDGDGFSHIEAECVKLSEEEYELKVGEYYFAEYITGEEGTLMVGEYTCHYSFIGETWVFTAFAYALVSNFAG